MPPGRWRAELSWGHSEGLSPSLGGPGPQVIGCPPTLQGAVEPMQIDVDPQEDPQNAPDVNYVVENPTLVGACRALWGLGGGAWASSTLALFRPETYRVSNQPCVMVVSTAGDPAPHSTQPRRARVLGGLQVVFRSG